MNAHELLADASGTASFSIELHEWSGPVAPPYQYNTKVSVISAGGGIELSYFDAREYQGGVPSKKIEFTRKLSREEAEGIVDELLKNDVEQLSMDFVGDRRNNVGISFNHFAFSVPGKLSARFDYILSDKRKDEFVRQGRILDIITGLKKFG